MDQLKFLSDTDWKVECEAGPLYFKDNHASVLAVAHLDTVNNTDRFEEQHNKDGLHVYCPQLDDRLGVYLILDYLPALGCKYDVLLTTGEETGQSTAENFETNKQYKWMFSFDRNGISTVLYQFDCEALREVLKPFEFQIEHGSFSDIGSLNQLKCAGINFGCGYQNNHSPDAFFYPSDTKLQLHRFMKFWDAHRNTVLPLAPDYDKAKTTFRFADWRGAQGGDDWYWKRYPAQGPTDKQDYTSIDQLHCDYCNKWVPADEMLSVVLAGGQKEEMCASCYGDAYGDGEGGFCEWCSVEVEELLEVHIIGYDQPLAVCADCYQLLNEQKQLVQEPASVHELTDQQWTEAQSTLAQ